jgi:hypothetical protein
MPTSELRFRPRLRHAALALAVLFAIPACSNDTAPSPVPGGLTIVSGDAQYTRKGTQLEAPVAVRVTDDHGAPVAHMTVHFQVIEGGGRLSHASAATNNEGRASVHWTVGANTGNNRMRITVAENSALSAVATATSSNYYCAEEDPAFSAKFSGAHNLMMLTRQSSLTGGLAGMVRYDLDTGNLTFTGTSLHNYTEGAFLNVVRDCVFSANGDLFIAWNPEVLKVATDGSISHFATLESLSPDALPGAELAMTPKGVLVGCDAAGPFYVTCRDSVFRFEDAIYSGINDAARDAANNDALACDPTSGDVYFIYKADRDLLRIPFDGTTAGTKTKVADLSQDETDGARGMVVDGTDGSVYILVESASTKSIVKVTSGGTVTTEFDFFTRGAGDAAGIQSDLAIDRDPTRRFLYTLDTKNNVFLLYRLATHELFSLAPVGNVNAASDNNSGERVGLDVIPAAGP